MSMTPLEIAFERIEECRRTRSTSLDLSKLNLEVIPEQAFTLTWLKKLDVSGMGLGGWVREIPLAIQKLLALTEFDCSWQRISDLSPLSGLLQLQSLDCSRNIIIESDQLLHLSDDELPEFFTLSTIRDLSPLSGLLQLQSLDCSGNGIRDLSPLSGLLQLQSLDCSNNKVNDLSPLSGLLQLQSLDCSENEIRDLSPLSGLLQLQSLDCSENGIRDLSPLSGLLQLQSLDCNGNRISDLSPLSGLLQLQSLNCGDERGKPWKNFNNISDLSPLSGLLQLQSLDCSGNGISDLSPLSGLLQLQSLDCSGNRISDLSPLSGLLQLQSFYCGAYWDRMKKFNNISDLSPLSGLLQLQSLDCSNNKVNDLSPLSSLTRLQSLDCSYNEVSDISPIDHLLLSGQLKFLFFHHNPKSGIPLLLLGNTEEGDPDPDCLEDIKRYRQAILSSGSITQKQLKIQLIGNGRVGKTTLAYALEHKRAPIEPFKSTHGIVIKEIQQALDGEDEPFTLQLWDFGGQEIYHATHRLFLSDDCLYLLLWAEETEEHPDETRHPVSYWLELIHDLAPNSQVIIVKNQIDRSDRLLTRPAELTEDMPGVKQIRQEVKISAKQYRGMPTLRGAIESVIEELKHKVCLELPTSWLQVQRELKQLDQNTIPFTHFKQLCIKAGIDHAEWFVGYLHKTGVLFYQEGAFQDQIILNQDWAIKAVYRVFDPQDQRSFIEDDLKGRFKARHAKIVWSDASETDREIYLDFMRNCGICYEPNHKHDTPFADRTFIIPALLPENSTARVAWHKSDKDWKLDIEYPFLHRSIIERIILRLGETYQGEPWRTGIFCNTEYGQVLLECTYHDKKQSTQGQLSFHLRGDQLAPLVYALRKLVSEISPHRRYQEFLQQGKTNRAALPEFKAAEENFSSRLDPIEPTKTLKLFISYSRVDRDHKLTLEKHLRLIKEALKHQVKLDIWSDHLMDAGEGVNDQILPELRSADLILLLVSPDFLDPERYSCRVELPIALERHEKEKTPVIPVIVHHTLWQGRLGHLTVATKENANPREDWPSDYKFWGSVESGIQDKIEKLLKT